MKFFKIQALIFSLFFVSCDPAALQGLMDQVQLPGVDQTASGLKEALNFGVDDAVKFLSAKDGYYQSPYKIFLPEEARKVVDKLKIVPGFNDVEKIIVEKINRSAEDAASKAAPIFLGAIKQMTIADATSILMGQNNAATQYLHGKTYSNLYGEFDPVIENSLNKFGALDYWTDAVTAYNKLPFVKDLNPDLKDHITSKALVGLFDLVEKKEAGIRTDVGQRTTQLLQTVFAKQDGK